MRIVRPLTPDGFVGYDEHDQFIAMDIEGVGRWVTYPLRNPLGKTCLICNQEWQLNHKSVKDQYFWHSREELVHKSCYRRYLTLRDWDMIYNHVCSFHLAFPGGLKEVENQYKGAWNTPWFEFVWKDAPTFTILIGPRKRVYHMEIKAPQQAHEGMPALDYRMAEKCFSEEDVTKEFGPTSVMVHAWSEEKVLAYLKKFVRILGLEEKVHGKAS